MHYPRTMAAGEMSNTQLLQVPNSPHSHFQCMIDFLITFCEKYSSNLLNVNASFRRMCERDKNRISYRNVITWTTRVNSP